jgi:hypothetical protein
VSIKKGGGSMITVLTYLAGLFFGPVPESEESEVAGSEDYLNDSHDDPPVE